MHFNDTRMRIQVDVPLYFRDWNSDQTLFEETVSDIISVIFVSCKQRMSI